MIKFYPYKIYEENNRKFVFANNSNGIFEIDDKAFSVIQQENKTEEEAYRAVADIMSREEFDELLDGMKRYAFYQTDENDEIIEEQYQKEIPSAFSNMTLFVAQGCNLRCTYCYGDGGSYHDEGYMDFTTAKRAIDYFVEQSAQNDLYVTFFGGEPLINFELIKKVTDYVRKIENTTDKRFFLSMTTNGTLIDEEKRKFILENKINTQISFDGIERVQNANRFYADKRGSYADVLNHTKELRDDEKVSCRATISPQGLNIVENFYHLLELKFRNIMFAPADNLLSDSDYEILTNEYIMMIKEFENLVREGKVDIAQKMKFVMSGLKKIYLGGVKNLVCGVGRNMYAVDIHGNLYPCQRFVGIEEFKMGNVEEGVKNRNAFLDKINIQNHKQCVDCWCKNLCLGNCPNENYYQTGCVNKTHPRVCKHTKIINEELVRLFLRLSEEERTKILSR